MQANIFERKANRFEALEVQTNIFQRKANRFERDCK